MALETGTVDYKTLIKNTSFAERAELTKSNAGQQLLATLKPSEVNALFPDYYKTHNPSVAAYISSRTQTPGSAGGSTGTTTPNSSGGSTATVAGTDDGGTVVPQPGGRTAGMQQSTAQKTTTGQSGQGKATPQTEAKPAVVQRLEQAGLSMQSDAKLGGSSGFDQQAPTVMKRLMADFNLTKEQAAGIVGNLGHESAGLQAGIQEKNPIAGRGGLGWAQWTGSRRREFERYLKDNNLSATDPEANYGFLKKELQTTHQSALEAIRKTNNVQDATTQFEHKYEGSADYDRRTGAILKPKSVQSRMNYAGKAATLFDDSERQYAENGNRVKPEFLPNTPQEIVDYINKMPASQRDANIAKLNDLINTKYGGNLESFVGAYNAGKVDTASVKGSGGASDLGDILKRGSEIGGIKDYDSFKGLCGKGARGAAGAIFNEEYFRNGLGSTGAPTAGSLSLNNDYLQKSGLYQDRQMLEKKQVMDKAYLDSLPIGTVISSTHKSSAGHVQVKGPDGKWISDKVQSSVLVERGSGGDYGNFAVHVPNEKGLAKLSPDTIKNDAATAAYASKYKIPVDKSTDVVSTDVPVQQRQAMAQAVQQQAAPEQQQAASADQQQAPAQPQQQAAAPAAQPKQQAPAQPQQQAAGATATPTQPAPADQQQTPPAAPAQQQQQLPAEMQHASGGSIDGVQNPGDVTAVPLQQQTSQGDDTALYNKGQFAGTVQTGEQLNFDKTSKQIDVQPREKVRAEQLKEEKLQQPSPQQQPAPQQAAVQQPQMNNGPVVQSNQNDWTSGVNPTNHIFSDNPATRYLSRLNFQKEGGHLGDIGASNYA